VVIRVNIAPPTSRGSHPPSNSFSRFAPRKLSSKARNSATSGTTRQSGHFHRSRATTPKMVLVMAIVPVTAMP
jgi:hypothetical protein